MCVLLKTLYWVGFIKLHKQYDYLLVKENVYKGICDYYYKYCSDFCYKSPVNNMISMFSVVVIVNIVMIYVINLYRKYVLFLVIG